MGINVFFVILPQLIIYKMKRHKILLLYAVGLLVIVFVILFATKSGSLKMCAQTSKENYVMIFSDEFNQPSGSAPDVKKWSTNLPRAKAIWNRWIADSPKLVYVKNGNLVCRAIPNTILSNDTAAMLTGALETKGKFSFKYGKIEVRLKTNLKDGNFPAVWLMPEPPAKVHPYGGEIDIFESYGKSDAYFTAHTHWTVNLGKKETPQHQFHERVKLNKWHIYGLIWEKDRLIWTLDGKTVGVYTKLDSKEAKDNGQWPFDHPFFIRMNQSLGNETWKRGPSLKDVYETKIDWVRVYKKL